MVRHHARAVAAATLAALLGLSFGRPIGSLALVGDTETVAASFSTETLDPPMTLSCTAQLGLIVDLSWIATVDLRATGYQVFRGTVNGGPYTQIATITPTTTTTYQDLPVVPATYYYVLKTYFGSWTSVDSNQSSCLAG